MRRSITWSGAVVLLALACLTAALAARSLGRKPSPPMSACLASPVRLDARQPPFIRNAHWINVSVVDPRGIRVWWGRFTWAGLVSERFVPVRTGLFHILYRSGRRRAVFDLLVVQCRSGIVLRDNDRGRKLLSLRNAKPGARNLSCIVVTYAGNAPARLRLYGRTGGTGLDRYLELTIVRGYKPRRRAFDSCQGFRPDRRNYLGAGPGVIFRGTLRAFPDSYLGGRGETWTPGESHMYKFVVRLRDANAAQGLRATQTFTWEARSQ